MGKRGGHSAWNANTNRQIDVRAREVGQADSSYSTTIIRRKVEPGSLRGLTGRELRTRINAADAKSA